MMSKGWNYRCVPPAVFRSLPDRYEKDCTGGNISPINNQGFWHDQHDHHSLDRKTPRKYMTYRRVKASCKVQ